MISFNLKKFLFSNLTQNRTIFKNISWLGVAEFITKSLKFLLFIFIARKLGVREYGIFAFALSFASLFAILTDCGVGGIMVRELSSDREKEKEYPALFSLKVLLSILTLLLIILGSFFITQESYVREIIIILGATIAINGIIGFFYSSFTVRQKMEYQAIVQICQAVFNFIIVLSILSIIPSVRNLSLCYLYSAVFALLLALGIFSFKIHPFRFQIDLNVWKKYLKLSWPLAFTGFLGGICGNIDSVMMGYLGQITQIGWYNASFKIAGVAFLPATLISQSFFPALNSTFHKTKQEFQIIFHNFLEITVGLGLPITVGGIILSPQIISAIYGVSYIPAALSLQILMIMIFLSYVLCPFNQYFIIVNKQKWLLYSSFIGALTNVILNIILIPKYSLNGAALATVLSTLVTIFITLYLYKQIGFSFYKTFLSFVSAFIKSGIATLFMSLFILLLLHYYKISVYWMILAGSIIYLFSYKILYILFSKSSYTAQKL